MTPVLSLIIHQYDLPRKELYRRFILEHGGSWTVLPSGEQSENIRLTFPVDTVFEEQEAYRRKGLKKYLLTFPDGAYLFWFQCHLEGLDYQGDPLENNPQIWNMLVVPDVE